MIHILIMILKIIGWLLLILVGLLLVVLGTVLFSPIRYRFDMKYHEKLEGKAKVTWFSHIVSICVEYQENQLQYRVKLFGIQVFPNNRKKEQRKQKRRVERKKKVPETIGHLSTIEEDSEIEEAPKKERKKQNHINSQEKQSETREIETDKKQEKINEEKIIQSENVQEEKLPVIIEEKKREKKSLWNRVKDGWKRLKQFVKKIKESFQAIPKKIKKIRKKWRFLLEKIRYYREFYQDEITQRAIQFIKNILKKACIHTLPRKFEGTIVFGTDDPALTGQILGILSMGMPFYKDKLRVCPVFDESVFEFEGKGKGKIQIGYYVYLGLRVILHKDVRQVITRVRKEFKKAN